MHTTSTHPLVSIRFGNLDTFCAELAERGPNVEPVVRICQHVRQAESDIYGPLPLENVWGHVSYLRRTGDVLQVSALHLYLGQRGAYAGGTPDRADVKTRIDQLYDRVRGLCHTRPTTWWTAACIRSPEHNRTVSVAK
jgi:hypothetical protein